MMNGFKAVFGAGLILVGMTTACSSGNTDVDDAPGEYNVITVPVNGKQVTCITWSDYKKGGLACDWANAK